LGLRVPHRQNRWGPNRPVCRGRPVRGIRYGVGHRCLRLAEGESIRAANPHGASLGSVAPDLRGQPDWHGRPPDSRGKEGLRRPLGSQGRCFRGRRLRPGSALRSVLSTQRTHPSDKTAPANPSTCWYPPSTRGFLPFSRQCPAARYRCPARHAIRSVASRSDRTAGPDTGTRLTENKERRTRNEERRTKNEERIAVFFSVG